MELFDSVFDDNLEEVDIMDTSDTLHDSDNVHMNRGETSMSDMTNGLLDSSTPTSCITDVTHGRMDSHASSNSYLTIMDGDGCILNDEACRGFHEVSLN